MMHRLLFDETLIVNEAQAPPTGLLCEVAGEMMTWKDFIILPFLIIMQHYESVLCSSCIYLIKNTEKNVA